MKKNLLSAVLALVLLVSCLAIPSTAYGASITGLRVTEVHHKSEITLHWNYVPGASYYKVYFKRGDGTREGWDTTYWKENVFTSKGNDITQDYYVFTVHAMDSSGKEICRNSIAYNMNIDPLDPSAERCSDQTQVKLTWKAVSGATNYKVYFKRGDGTRQGWDASNCTATSFTSKGNDTTQYYYVYEVYAMNSSGKQLYKSAVVFNMRYY